MALIMRYIDSMQRYMDSYGDPRTKDWPMMSSPFPTLAVCLSYVYIVKVLGPKFMENRKPFQLQNTLIVYNFIQVIFSAWLFYECLMGGWWGAYSFRCQPVDYSPSATATRISISGWLTGHYNFRCQPVDYSNHPKTLRMVHACWWYYFSKFTEFMDTIFSVMRKKTSQVTTLHVIHHGCMPMSVWFGVKFTPGGHSTFFGLLNTFVHIVMYTYYMFAAMGPQYQRFLWWKKYLTALQMVQFVAIMVHAFQLLFIDCNYPRAFVWWIGMHAVMFFFLFNEFYKSTYKAKQDRIFSVMRKKTSQVTTLHVIHHGCMPMSVWFGVKFTPGGHSTFFGLLNTFVHIVMYTYYMFAAMGPQYQRFLWWKKYLTALQMVQFVAIMVHAFQLLFIDCNYPRAFVWWIGMHAVMFFFLFNEFYKSTYKAKQDRLRREAEQKKNAILHNGVKQNGSIKENGLNENGTKHQNGTITNGSIHKRLENGNGIANGGITIHRTESYGNNDSPTDLTRRKVQK